MYVSLFDELSSGQVSQQELNGGRHEAIAVPWASPLIGSTATPDTGTRVPKTQRCTTVMLRGVGAAEPELFGPANR